jgi:hypothetical protein
VVGAVLAANPAAISAKDEMGHLPLELARASGFGDGDAMWRLLLNTEGGGAFWSTVNASAKVGANGRGEGERSGSNGRGEGRSNAFDCSVATEAAYTDSVLGRGNASGGYTEPTYNSDYASQIGGGFGPQAGRARGFRRRRCCHLALPLKFTIRVGVANIRMG